MDPIREQQLLRIKALTTELLSACGREEWDALVDIESRRGRLIRMFFQTAPSADESAQIASAIHWIRSTDQKVISLCQSQKQQIAQKLSGMTKGKSVKASYQQY